MMPSAPAFAAQLIPDAPGPLLPHYPADFVIPDRQPYAYTVDMGVVRSAMAAGNARQRRIYNIMPHALALSFHMRIEELAIWQSWVNANAYSWFRCPVSTMYAGAPPTPGNIRNEILRFTGDLQITSDGWNWVGVAVTAELSPDAFAFFPPVAAGGWIVGGTPAAPNSALWFIGGTPAAPSPAWAIGGTPAFPSSVV